MNVTISVFLKIYVNSIGILLPIKLPLMETIRGCLGAYHFGALSALCRKEKERDNK